MSISKQCLMSIIVAFVFVGASFSEENKDLYKQYDKVFYFNQLFTTAFDFNLFSPERFLEFLKKDAYGAVVVNSVVPHYQITDPPPDDWIKPEHIPGLINLINSQEPCRPVTTIQSSTIPTKLSTIGDEAMFLIEGFREKRYPPWPNSQTYSSKERKAMLQWWNEFSKKNDFKK